MTEPVRVSPEETRRRSLSGAAVLVCAYEDDDKFKTMHLEGALSFSEFKQKLAALPKEQEIILYCA